MRIFVDSSAFVALLVAEDENHPAARKLWDELRRRDDRLVTTNYVVLETCGVLHRRFGTKPLHTFVEDFLPIVLVEWVDVNLHLMGIGSLLMSSRRGPNIVDCVSFAAMRKLNIRNVFTFDPHFRQQGFTIMPKAG